jgi:hypothetical protein
MAAGIALDIIGRWLVQQFHHTNADGLVLWHLDPVMCDIIGIQQEEQQIPPKRNKEKEKNIF